MIFNGFVWWGIYMDLPIPKSIADEMVGFNGSPFLGTTDESDSKINLFLLRS